MNHAFDEYCAYRAQQKKANSSFQYSLNSRKEERNGIEEKKNDTQIIESTLHTNEHDISNAKNNKRTRIRYESGRPWARDEERSMWITA